MMLLSSYSGLLVHCSLVVVLCEPPTIASFIWHFLRLFVLFSNYISSFLEKKNLFTKKNSNRPYSLFSSSKNELLFFFIKNHLSKYFSFIFLLSKVVLS